MSKFQRALAAGVAGGASVYGEQQKAIRVNKADQAQKEAEYDRKENFARFGKQLSRDEQIIGRRPDGMPVYAGDQQKKALPSELETDKGYETAQEIKEGQAKSGKYLQGKELSNKELANLDEKQLAEVKTSEQYQEWKTGLSKRDYRTATDSRFEKIDEMVAAKEMTKAEGVRAKKSAIGAVPKKKGFESQVKIFTKTLADNDYGGLDKYAQDELVAQTYSQTAAADPAFAAELRKDKTMKTRLDNVSIASDLVRKANDSFNGDMDKAAEEYLKEKGGGKQAKAMIDAAKKWADGRYQKDEDKGYWFRDDSTFKMEKK